MKQSSKLLTLKVFMLAKLLAFLLMLLFPQVLLKVLYPFSLFSPFLLAAMAYTNIPQWLLLFVLIVVIVLGLFFSFCVIYLFIKNRFIKNTLPILAVFFLLEMLSFLLSIFSVLSFGKCVGLLFNAIILCLAWKIRNPQQ